MVNVEVDDGSRSTATSDDPSRVLVDGIVIVDVDSIADARGVVDGDVRR
jgi:hypothetical protein